MKIQFNNEWVNFSENGNGQELVNKFNLTQPQEALAIEINGEVYDLYHPLKEGDSVKIISFNDDKGKQIFWHTSAHVLAQAVLRLWPQAQPTIGPAIENGFYYDFANLTISDEDFEKIEKEVTTIIQENYVVKRHVFQNKEQAIQKFQNNPYKVELITNFEDGVITAYQQGEFIDLCRGPHLPILGKIKAFKILKTSGAYWKGDPSKEMLTRIYGISYPDRKLLKDYLTFLEEAKKRDHKILGPKLDIFSIKEEAPGMPFIHPKGMLIWNRLLDFLRQLLQEAGYLEIKTPLIMTTQLWQQSGHWNHYKENMYSFEIEDRTFAIKPMNCPGCILYYKGSMYSYRDLPLRIAEFGHVHRQEASGALSGLFRVRSFHQDDAHLFLKEDDIKKEILSIFQLIKTIYETFGLTYRFELSTRPENSIAMEKGWEIATQSLKDALKEWGSHYLINEGDGAFYGPKIDIHIKDALGRSWQCGTIQLDMALPEKFDLEYTDKDGISKRPVLLHRAIFGSIERFLGILIEHFAGKFPLWISPRPLRILTIADRHISYAEKIKKEIENSGFLCEIDQSQESMNKKVRNAQLLHINYMLTVGDKEMEHQTIAVRTRDNVVYGEMKLDFFLKIIMKEFKERLLKSEFKETMHAYHNS